MALETRVGKPLRVLLVEDSDQDAALLLVELEQNGYDVLVERVQTAEELRVALEGGGFDVVISDYCLPTFSAPEALAIVQEKHADIPFIIVSGTVGEETAVSALKAGASDFLVKGKMARLAPALERELREAEVKRERARERETLEAQLRQAQKLEGIGRLAGGIAHDFNNLLTAIIGYTEMVLEQIGPDKPISHDLEEIRKASDRAAILTRQLLAFSRKQTLRVAAVDVNEVVMSMRNMLQRMIGEDINLQVDLTKALPSMLADRAQLEQVLMNLVINARDAMPRAGTLSVETALATPTEIAGLAGDAGAAGYAKLSVTDTGTGMDAATQARIFEPFFTTKPIGQGTGLGLSTVYGVVQQLGGHITVRTAPGQGTTFALCFPIASETDAAIAASTPRKGHAPLAEGRELVLVVEDQQAVLELVSRVLTRHGYNVLEAESGAAALALAESTTRRIDLVLTDIVMPVMDGSEMVELLRRTRPHVKVLFMSGYSGDIIARRGGLPADADVLEKPFSASVLLRAVREALGTAGDGAAARPVA
jgi:two-component system cell cycle sensor histidine kinase/response regulator CckA